MSEAGPFSLSRFEVRELDRRAIEEYGIPGIVLMENAGHGCAKFLIERNLESKPIVILCGPGNNGGDGFVIARYLDNAGFPVEVFTAGKIESSTGDAGTHLAIAQASGISIRSAMDNERFQQAIDRSGWLVDSLFGTGLSRPLQSPFNEIVEQINASQKPILAIDLPSGLDCDTGTPLGPTVKATHTVTFVAWKKGFSNPLSRKFTGEIHIVEIGVPRQLIEAIRRTPRS